MLLLLLVNLIFNWTIYFLLLPSIYLSFYLSIFSLYQFFHFGFKFFFLPFCWFCKTRKNCYLFFLIYFDCLLFALWCHYIYFFGFFPSLPLWKSKKKVKVKVVDQKTTRTKKSIWFCSFIFTEKWITRNLIFLLKKKRGNFQIQRLLLVFFT